MPSDNSGDSHGIALEDRAKADLQERISLATSTARTLAEMLQHLPPEARAAVVDIVNAAEQKLPMAKWPFPCY